MSNSYICYRKYYSLFKFRIFHSTESALLKVLNNIYMVTPQGDSIVLVLLDLTAEFDMIYNNIVIARLKSFCWLDRNCFRLF